MPKSAHLQERVDELQLDVSKLESAVKDYDERLTLFSRQICQLRALIEPQNHSYDWTKDLEAQRKLFPDYETAR